MARRQTSTNGLIALIVVFMTYAAVFLWLGVDGNERSWFMVALIMLVALWSFVAYGRVRRTARAYLSADAAADPA